MDTHAITSHFAIPLLINTPGGLVVEVTDGTDDYNATHYRVSFFYDLAKASVNRMAFALAQLFIAVAPAWQVHEPHFLTLRATRLSFTYRGRRKA